MTPSSRAPYRIKRRDRNNRLAPLSIIVVLALSGCSGSEDSSEPSEPSGSTTVAASDAGENGAGDSGDPDGPVTVEADPDSATGIDGLEAPPVSTENGSPATADDPGPDDPLSPPGEQGGEQGGESLGPLGATEAEFETEDGTVQIGAGDVPEQASRLPLPDDFAVRLSSETPTASGVTGTTALPFDEVVALYDEGLEPAGFTVTERMVTNQVFAVFDFESGTEEGNVAVATTPGSDEITITLALADR